MFSFKPATQPIEELVQIPIHGVDIFVTHREGDKVERQPEQVLDSI
jgi:hypothetical protein